MSELIIRAPRADEAEALAELHGETWRETYRGIFPESAWGEEAHAQRVSMWSAICGHPMPSNRFAVAERAGTLIGLAGVGPSLDTPPVRAHELHFIYLRAHEHGSGAGQALLDAVLGDEPASLWVVEHNSRAQAFYARNGFVRDGARQATGFDSGGEAIRMVR